MTVTQDFAKKKRKSGAVKQDNRVTRQKPLPAPRTWAWFFSGVLCGIFLCFLTWLAAQQPDTGDRVADNNAATQGESPGQLPKPDFSFYTRLKEQDVTVEVDPADVSKARQVESMDQYLLQAGSFRQKEDAEQRRAELILMGLEPRVEKTEGKKGSWFRVYMGPFKTRSKLQKARSLTAQQGIETLMLKRPGG